MGILNILTSSDSSNNPHKSNSEEIYDAYTDFDKAYDLVRREATKDEELNIFNNKIRNVFPFINFVTDNLSKMYDTSVLREIDEDNKDNKELNKLLEEVNREFKKVDKSIDKYTFLTGTTLVKPYFNRETNKFKFLVFPSHMCDYDSYATDPSEAKRIKVEYYNNNVKQSEVWDNNSVNLYTDGTKIDKNTIENPYGFIPFIKFENENNSFNYFDKPKTGLLKTQNMLSIKLINTDRTFKYQARSLLVLKSEQRELDQLKIGPSQANQIGSEDSLEFVTNNSDLTQLVEYIKQEFSMFSKLNNIPDSIFDINSSASGVSIVASKAVINDYIKERREKFIDSERELFKKSILVLAKSKNITIPEDFEINIKYKELKEPLSEDEINQWDFLIRTNVSSPIDIIMERNNVSREEAEDIFNNNKKFNEENNVITEENVVVNEDEV